ncbi:FAD-binding oxidoreductase [Qingshengfaniella alkalisoli]|uniref:FAD-binding oxidoreductase n=2 Tax=Qingshengfaniella alkalisoli TaxID=2599296 RepID=A0A5B8IZF3_9RHOB|nr:FAD-binding oxidoreductase [Qingshengfaniella alkalisoli]
MVKPDVTVFGAGIFGLSVAYSCAKRGAKVRIIDKRGVAAGSSGGVVGALAPHTPENWNQKKAFQFDALLAAQAHWAEVARIGGLSSGYGRTGRIQPVLDEHGLELASQRAVQSRELWRGQAEWAVKATTDLDGWTPQTPTGFVIHDTLSARIHPRRSCEALAAALVVLKAEIVIGEGASAEGKVVWATGYEGLVEISEQLDQRIGNGVKGQAMLLALDRSGKPHLFSDGIYVVPHADGTVGVGSTSERDFDDPTATDGELDKLLGRAIAICPQLADARVLTRWAGVRPRAMSRAPMLGKHPVRDSDFIANGGFKIGFAMGPKAGEMMADLVLEGHDAIPDEFRVEASLTG